MTYTSLLNNSIKLREKYSSQNEIGEWTFSYSSSTINTKCRMSPVSNMEMITKPGLYEDVKYKCFCLSSAAITIDSQVQYRDEYYRVKQVIIDSSHHHKTALLKEIVQ